MSAEWVDRLHDHVRRVGETADRLDALEALLIDLARDVRALDAAVRGHLAAQDAAALRRAALEAEARRAEG